MPPLLLQLNHKSPTPPYEQIRIQLRMLIASGQLLPGTSLPSVRQLARDLDIVPNTVVRAYNELVQDGWLAAAPRRGFVVAGCVPAVSAEERAHYLEEAVAELLIKIHQLGINLEEVYAELHRQATSQVSQ